jgi:ADP-ribose pyrophosphatase YjhB (NUDIX family)
MLGLNDVRFLDNNLFDSTIERESVNEQNWIQWARALQAISQTGLHFSEDQYDKERYQQIAKIAAEILAHRTNLSAKKILELNASEFGYATPKVDVRGVVFKGSKILLVREIADHGRWTLPGGWADVNETPSQATIREILEESGFETQVVKLLAVYDREKQGHIPPFPYHVYKLFFLCEITGGSARAQGETSEVAFFGEFEIPELSSSRVKEEQLRRFFKHARNVEFPTDYD